MTNLGWIIAGGAAASGVVGMFWSHLKGLWGQLASRIIVSCELRGHLSTAVGMYLWQHYPTSRFGFRTYIGASAFVRPVKRVQVVGVEVVGNSGRLYWCGWLPLWFATLPTDDKAALRVGNEYYWGGSKLVFLRGTLNPDKLLTDALAEYNHFQANSDGAGKTRYQIHHIFGTAGKPISLLGSDTTRRDSESKATSDSNLSTQRTLQWKPGDLGASRMNHGNALAQMALSPEAQTMVEEVRRWLKSEDWHKARGIPWRRGWLLHGGPGTGKTSLIRAIAEDFDLPVYVFDLATLFNNELQIEWQKMLSCVPCVALFEDIDAVFEGRENKVGGHLTFDCLLNCIDGIERTDGVLLVITTNHLDRLDAALGVPSAQVSTRPGRIDRVLELHGLDDAGRLHLCQRILPEWPETWEETIRLGKDETGAQFQERCFQLAKLKLESRQCLTTPAASTWMKPNRSDGPQTL